MYGVPRRKNEMSRNAGMINADYVVIIVIIQVIIS